MKSRLWAIVAACSISCVVPLRAADPSWLPRAVKIDENLLKALDNSFWIGDGGPPARHIYVLAAPWCPGSQSFYQITAGHKSRVQFRWVETGAADATAEQQIGEAGMLRDASVLRRMYVSLAMPKSVDEQVRDIVIRQNRAVFQAIDSAVFKQSGKHVVYPSLIWLSDQGAFCRIPVLDPRDIVTSVVARPEAVDITPGATAFLKAQYQWGPPPQAGRYTPIDGPVEMFALPDSASQMGLVLDAGRAYPAGHRSALLNGERWIELEVYKNDRWGYFVRDRQVRRIQ